MTNFFTISHASRAAQVAEDTVRYAVKRGHLTVSARTEGGTALFTREDLDAWIQRRRLTSRRPVASTDQPEAA